MFLRIIYSILLGVVLSASLGWSTFLIPVSDLKTRLGVAGFLVFFTGLGGLVSVLLSLLLKK